MKDHRSKGSPMIGSGEVGAVCTVLNPFIYVPRGVCVAEG